MSETHTHLVPEITILCWVPQRLYGEVINVAGRFYRCCSANSGRQYQLGP
jgi:hypothetical protein